MYQEPEIFSIQVENRVYSLADVSALLESIIKPKFQRKLQWSVLPGKSQTQSNFQEYIDFLRYATRYESNGISLGEQIMNNKIIYYVIDGNNRLNALFTFLTLPFLIYPNYLREFEKFIESSELETISKMSLNDIHEFRTIRKLFPENEFSSEKCEQIEETMFIIREKFMFMSKSCQDVIKINFSIYKNGTFDEYCKVFAMSNRYFSKLSENHLLASTLYHTTCQIENQNHSDKIFEYINKYYENRDDGEVLESQVVDDYNVFDYILALQNYCHDICEWIPTFDNVDGGGLALFFKIFKCIEDKPCISPDIFTNENVNKFICSMVDVSMILKQCRYQLLQNGNMNENFLKNFKSEEKFLRKNNIFVIIASILSIIKNDSIITGEMLVKMVNKVLFFHILCESLADDESNLIQREQDKLKYQAGGKFIEAKCQKIWRDSPFMIFESIQRETFLQLFHSYIAQERENEKKRKFSLLNKMIYSCVSLNEYNFLINVSKKVENVNLYRVGNIKFEETTLPFQFRNRKTLDNAQLYNLTCLENEKKIEEIICEFFFP